MRVRKLWMKDAIDYARSLATSLADDTVADRSTPATSNDSNTDCYQHTCSGVVEIYVWGKR